MDQSITDIRRLLFEVAEHIKTSTKPDQSAAVAKLGRIVALASTLAFTIQGSRR